MNFDFDWYDNFDLADISIAGSLSEEMSEEERNRKEIEDGWNSDSEDDHSY